MALIEWFCGGCGRRRPAGEDRWCPECGAAYRTSFGKLPPPEGDE